MTQVFVPEARDLFALTETYLGREELGCVHEAFELARREHGDERRKSGELFFTHPLTVAYYLAEYQADVASITAALLHDVAEDTRVSVAQIQDQFGEEVARLVDGLTKFEAVTEGVEAPRLSKEQVQTATLHKLFGVMTADLRVGIIKLFDRLHNMQTISATTTESQQRKAKETLAVYAPLANRLGMWRLRNELGSLAVQILYPEAFWIIKQRLEQLRHQQQADYFLISRQILEQLGDAGIQGDVQQSPESIFSIFNSAMVKMNGSLRFEIDETLRVVVQVKDVPSCYLALGYIHQMWPPVPHKFDDYIARPRDNLYSALHTTVNHSTGQRLKVRFRTRAMNILSEIGIMARWVQIGMPLWSRELAERLEVIAASISENINMEPQNPVAGVQGVVEDVFRQQILVYTPRGDVKQLPQGATPIDFAYAIHTDVGNQCFAARVNGQRYPLNRPLQDGDRVFIEKKESHTPERTWLDEDLGYTTTRYARTNVRRWFRRLSGETAVAEGRALVEKELKMIGLPDYPHYKIAQLLDYSNLGLFYHDVGRAEILPTTISTQVLEQNWDRIPARDIGREVWTEQGLRLIVTNTGARRLRLCRTCRPGPDDNILGFIRADGAVTVHTEICTKLPSDPLSGRILKLRWVEEGVSRVRLITIKTDVYDRPNLLLEIAEFLRAENVNIHNIHTSREEYEKSIVLELEVMTPRQVVRILHRVQALVNVHDVYAISFHEDKDVATSPYYLPE